MTGFDLELAPWAVLRVAAWPPDILTPLRTPDLRVPEPPSPPLTALHAVVPTAPREERRVLLEAGRRWFGSPDPLPPTCLETVRRWLPEVDEEQRRREALATFKAEHEAAMARARRYLQALPEDFLKALAVARPDIDPDRRSRKTEATLYHFLCRAAGRPTPNALWAGCRLIGPSDGLDGARHQFSPHLGPFRQLVRWLQQRPGPRRADPTAWHHDGVIYHRVEGENGWEHRTAPTGADLSWPTLEFPVTFRDAWEALDRVTEQLAEPHWASAVSALRALCDGLARDYPGLNVAEVRRSLSQAQAIVVELCHRCGAPPPTGPFLWAECSPDVQVEVDWEAARRAIETTLEFYGRLGAHEPLSLAIPERLRQGCPDGDLARTVALDLMAWNRSAMGRDRWADLPGGDFWARHPSGRVRMPEGQGRPHSPLGSASIRRDGRRVWMGALTPEPWVAYSRVASFIDPAGHLQKWLRDGFRELEARWQVRFAELACPLQDRPNLAARTPFVDRTFEPYVQGLEGIRLEDSLLRMPDPVIPLFTSSGLVGRGDKLARLLQLLWFHHGRAGLARDFPAFDRDTPRYTLDDVVLCPRRWFVPGEVLQATGAERYLRWRRFVGEQGIPDWVYACGEHHATPELLATDSPFGVSLLAGPTRLEEVPPPWAVDAEGRAHHAELVFCFKNHAVVRR